MPDISVNELKELFLRETPLIDVRAPVEFAQGTLPGAVNLPLLDDAQRAAVGTTYKQSGSDEAVKLGHQFISGDVKESRLRSWAEYIGEHPGAVLFCYRGGMRSQITQQWLSERGIQRPLIEGGYKRGRQFLRNEIESFARQRPLLILAGPTGSAKTEILKAASAFFPSVDLEALARHRGSAFGGLAKPQPSQVDFENTLAVNLLRFSALSPDKKILLEDESRLIGRCAIPLSLFARMREAETVYVEEAFEQRVENIFRDYVLQTAIGTADVPAAKAQFDRYRQSTTMISRRLGGARSQEIMQDLALSEARYLENAKDLESNKIWIAKLLNYYYDPLYSGGPQQSAPNIVARGNAEAILDYLRREAGC